MLRPLTTLYLDLHRHPELSGEEERTAGRFADWLESAGYETARGIGGHGVAGVLRRGEGPTVVLRAELDALPVRETTGLPYASEGPAAHACGHDLHLAAAAGTASLLAGDAAGAWRGTLVVVGQPAEETLEGARAMLADGLYERVGHPDVVLAQHAAPLPAGMVAHGYGPMTAGSVTFRVVVHGRGGHAGAPHLTVDPVVTAAHVVTRLQTVVAREAAPSEQVAVTVGSLRAGERANVVPDRAELGITVRAAGEAALARAAEAVERIVRAECAASGCPREPEIVREGSSPVTHPDPATTAAVRAAHTTRLGRSEWRCGRRRCHGGLRAVRRRGAVPARGAGGAAGVLDAGGDRPGRLGGGARGGRGREAGGPPRQPRPGLRPGRPHGPPGRGGGAGVGGPDLPGPGSAGSFDAACGHPAHHRKAKV
ncbi:LOW QUALITY PROTEIN: predicted protein, partial [Streptomyces sp. C]